MEVGTAMAVVQSLFAALQCSQQLKEICSIACYKNQLQKLRRTVSYIEAVLVDAQEQSRHHQQLLNHDQLYLEDLKDALYEADDLLDEFVTLAQQQNNNVIRGINKKNVILSPFSKFRVAYKMFQEVKKIRDKLDAIAYNSQFGPKRHAQQPTGPHPIVNKRPDSCSFVPQDDIVGREGDLESIVGFLQESNNTQESISFLAIAGMGGLGKTALAQLVFNDERVKSAFPLRLWTCVSDHDPNQCLDIEGILDKILASATGRKPRGYSTMEAVQCQLRQKLDRKYLLVLDDVWTESREQWVDLVKYLEGGQSGSWVIVTTRSWKTARIVGDGPIHKLQGLSKEDSWNLFKRMAFGSPQSNPPEDLVEIGQVIVKNCAQVPLAIRVVGSLLYGEDKHKWLSFQRLGLEKIRDNKNKIMPALKLSYDLLESPLKTCFSYCALFPKDSIIEKATLVRLWMAQGYIQSDGHQSMEDVAEEFFSILLQRCFFHDVRKDEQGAVKSCKIHDLMHDVAQEVVGKQICRVRTITGNMDRTVRHLSLIRNQSSEYSFTKNHMRSYLYAGEYWNEVTVDYSSMEALFVNWKYLRALDLRRSNIENLPGSIGGLLHLRYLDLSCNFQLKELPQSVGTLHNLQTLNLTYCAMLKELPKDTCKIGKLRVLDIKGCDDLSCMPRGLGNLNCLHTLPMYIVGEESGSWKSWHDGLKDLKSLRNLKGSLRIKIQYFNGIEGKGVLANVKTDDRLGGGCLTNKEGLCHMNFDFIKEKQDGEEGREEYDATTMEELLPHSNLKRLDIKRYHGVRMPSWASEGNLGVFLPNLVKIQILGCPHLQCLGCLGNLQHLKVLYLQSLQNLEYISESCVERCPVFPSLEQLKLQGLGKLKGWMRDNDQLLVDSSSASISIAPLQLPRLRDLFVYSCQNLIATLQCPALEELCLERFNSRLPIITSKETGNDNENRKDKATSSSSSTRTTYSKLKKVKLDKVRWLNSLPMEAFQDLKKLNICYDTEVNSLAEVGKVFRSCSTSLQSLEITSAFNLRSLVSGAVEYLTALKALKIRSCPRLSDTEIDSFSFSLV